MNLTYPNSLSHCNSLSHRNSNQWDNALYKMVWKLLLLQILKILKMMLVNLIIKCLILQW
jgi:hypothetical protein